MDQLLRDLEEFIRKEFLFDRPEAELGPETSLIESGIVDSLGILTLIEFLQERLGTTIEAEEVLFDNFETMDAILRLAATRSG